MGAGIRLLVGCAPPNLLGNGQGFGQVVFRGHDGQRAFDAALNDGQGRVVGQDARFMQPAKKHLQGGDTPGVRFGAARHAAVFNQPFQKVVQVVGTNFPNGLANAQIFAQQPDIAGKGFHCVDGKSFVSHMSFKQPQSCLDGGVGGEGRCR
jgi:hypothetical protein